MNMLTFLKYLRGIFKTVFNTGQTHHAIIQSIYDSFLMVDGDLDLMRLEMCLSTATGKWLDYWGDFFTVYRKLDETDSAYSKRIIEYVIRPKTTIPAIKDYIVDFLNEEYHAEYTRDDVSIKEPWKDLGKLSHKGLLSKDARFFSGDYYSHSVLDISIPEKLTQDLIDLVLAVKAAGVKIMWSFLNSYDIIKGFNETDEVWANYVRHIQQYVPRVTYSGLMLSNTSYMPTLSGRREIWFWMTNLYEWYAKMENKNTDLSEVITPMDLAGLFDYYEIIETVFNYKDTGSKISHNPDGVLDNLMKLSGAKTEEETITHLINITSDMLESMQLVDDWLRLSQEGKLSQEGTLFDTRPAYQLFTKIMATIDKWKENNRDYYDSLQPPVIVAEHIAMWYAARNKNWLFDTPTMSQQDFFELWEMDDKYEHHTQEDITRYEDSLGDKYLTFGDVYQPPIVLSGTPWDWTPIMDSPWLWISATLTNEELEEIYRMKFSGFPDLVTIETDITTRPELNLVLSSTGELSPLKYLSTTAQVREPEASLVLSGAGALDEQVPSGKAVQTIAQFVENPEFKGYTYLSGSESIVTKRRIVQEATPTLESLIEFEENQVENGQVWNPNEDINYSTRDWFQAPVQIGIYAMWLIVEHERQLWNTVAITNEEIEGYWNSPDGDADLETLPEYFEKDHVTNTPIYQPPIVVTDGPFYWTTKKDKPWLWLSATLTNEELEQIYWRKFGDNPSVFPDLVEVVEVAHRTPERAFRLSDNAYMNYNKVVTEVEEIKHPEYGFVLSHNGVISNRKTEYRTLTEQIDHPEDNLILSDQGVVSNNKYNLEITTIHHSEDNFLLSQSPLNSTYQVSGGDIEERHNLLDNPDFNGYKYLSGAAPEIVKTTQEITYEQLPLRFMSGSETQLITTVTIIPDTMGDHYMDGDKTTYTEEVTVTEHPPTLGKLMELEEQQLEFLYSTRDMVQAPIVIYEHQALWKIDTFDTQLWDSPAITNREILNYWEGADRPLTLKRLNKVMMADSTIYQAPIEITDGPFDWSIKIHFSQLWDSPTISNEDILKYWVGANKPKTVRQLAKQMPTKHRRHQPPVALVNHLMLPTNDTTAFEVGWLWTSSTITNDELETIYQMRYPGEFNENNPPTLERLIELEESSDIPHTHRGQYQGEIVVDNVMRTNILVPRLDTKLWNTPLLTNAQILSFWEGADKPTEEQFQQLLDTLPQYQPPIDRKVDQQTNLLDMMDQPWLWASEVLTNDDLEQFYNAQIGSSNPTLNQLINAEESLDPQRPYSKRGAQQSPVQITES